MSEFSDEARRIADTHNLHLTVDKNNAGRFFASKLSDGTTDGEVYDTRLEAIVHQADDYRTMYTCIQPVQMTYKEAEHVLAFQRQVYDAGLRMADTDNPNREAIMPTLLEDFR